MDILPPPNHPQTRPPQKPTPPNPTPSDTTTTTNPNPPKPPPKPKKPPIITLIALYIAGGWSLDMAQLIISALQLSTGPIADTDPDIYLTLPPYAATLQRLAVAWTSVGLVAHIVLGFRVAGLEDDHDAGQGRGRGKLVTGGWVPWSVLSLAVWGVYVGMQTGEGGQRVWGETAECREVRPTLSQCDLLWATWAVGWVYVVLHLILLGLFGLTFKRLGPRVENGLPSAPETEEVVAPGTGEVVGVADAPRDRWPPLS